MLSFFLYFLHYRQSTRACANDQTLAFPWYPLLCREWGVTKLIAEFLGSFLFSFTDASTIDDNVMIVGYTIDSDGAERKCFKPHMGASAGMIRAQTVGFRPPAE